MYSVETRRVATVAVVVFLALAYRRYIVNGIVQTTTSLAHKRQQANDDVADGLIDRSVDGAAQLQETPSDSSPFRERTTNNNNQIGNGNEKYRIKYCISFSICMAGGHSNYYGYTYLEVGTRRIERISIDGNCEYGK